MDISTINNYFIPIVVVFCLCIGYILRNFMPTDNKWIPLTLFVIGAICGAIVNGLTFEAIVTGAVSGLASTGLNQAFKQALGLNVRADIELSEDDAIDEMIAAEEDEAEDDTNEAGEQEA